MQKINQLKAEIADTIKESTEYKEYKRLEAIVNMDPNLKEVLTSSEERTTRYRTVDRLKIYLQRRKNLIISTRI